MTTQTSTRERILGAYEDLLIVDGPRMATLDAVAAAAGVSKGGLLYHFKSKEALTEALLVKCVRMPNWTSWPWPRTLPDAPATTCGQVFLATHPLIVPLWPPTA
ncbi:TetR/AcrR family transcriptional regulator [Arthrobacter alpinus]|nr:TetR/AcrR family transcriptional regulator [Arthrobacter alpinus]